MKKMKTWKQPHWRLHFWKDHRLLADHLQLQPFPHVLLSYTHDGIQLTPASVELILGTLGTTVHLGIGNLQPFPFLWGGTRQDLDLAMWWWGFNLKQKFWWWNMFWFRLYTQAKDRENFPNQWWTARVCWQKPRVQLHTSVWSKSGMWFVNGINAHAE